MLIILTSSDPHDTVKLVKLDDCGGGEGEVGGGGRATPVENSRLIGDPPLKAVVSIPAVPILTRFQITNEKSQKSLWFFFLTFFCCFTLDITEAHFTRNNLFLSTTKQKLVENDFFYFFFH